LILFATVLLILATWRVTTGSVSVSRIVERKTEIFYWTTILASNTLGTALGDYVADSQGFGFEGGAPVFGGLIAGVALVYSFTEISHTLLFWAAFILTRPLGATLGDILTKPLAHGGFNFDRMESSLALAAFMTLCIVTTSLRRPAEPGMMAH